MITNLPVSNDSIRTLTRGYVNEPWMQSGLALLLLGAFAWAANWVAKRIVLKLLLRLHATSLTIAQGPVNRSRRSLGFN